MDYGSLLAPLIMCPYEIRSNGDYRYIRRTTTDNDMNGISACTPLLPTTKILEKLLKIKMIGL